jgi:hypothetical protein
MAAGGKRERNRADRGPKAEEARAARGAPARTSGGAGSTDPDVAAADRYGRLLAGLFAAIGVLLLALAAGGRGWSFLLGAVDFLVIAAVLAWALRESRRRDPGPRPPSTPENG